MAACARATRPRRTGQTTMSNLRYRTDDVKPECYYVLRFCFGGGRNILVCLMSDARRFPPPWSGPRNRHFLARSVTSRMLS
jgi:hypothetical protein